MAIASSNRSTASLTTPVLCASQTFRPNTWRPLSVSTQSTSRLTKTTQPNKNRRTCRSGLCSHHNPATPMEKIAVRLQVGDRFHDIHLEKTSIGRESDNDIVLDHESVSGHHAEIVVSDNLVFLEDKESTNGTLLNGSLISKVQLNGGDVISFGLIETTFAVLPPKEEALHMTAYGAELATIPPVKATRDRIQFAKAELMSVTKAVWLTGKQFSRKAGWSILATVQSEGTMILHEVTRISKVVYLRAWIVKLNLVDLRRAFGDLGRYCYALRLCSDVLAPNYWEIESLRQRLRVARVEAERAKGINALQKFKSVARKLFHKAAAEGLRWRLRGNYVALGKVAASMWRDLPSRPQLKRLQFVQASIAKCGVAHQALLAPDTRIRHQNESLFCYHTNACELLTYWSRKCSVVGTPLTRKYGKVAVITLCCLAGISVVPRVLPKSWTVHGQVQLGDACAEGVDAKIDLPKAIYWYQLASNAGYADAQVKLGSAYLLGWVSGEPQDDLAVQWFRKAADQGDALGEHYLGWMYRNGRGVPRNNEQAFTWLSRSANQGYAAAQNLVAMMYFRGEGIEKNTEQSAKWHRLAADQGEVTSQMLLGAMYFKGVGVPQSNEDGLYWMEKACASGSSDAQTQLGIMFYNGHDVQQDRDRGLVLIRRAAENGNKKALEQIERLDRASSYKSPRLSEEDRELYLRLKQILPQL